MASQREPPLSSASPSLLSSPSQSTAPDESSTDQIAQALAQALAIPAANRWVADWLFTNLSVSPFHRSHPLPPTALESSLSLNSTTVAHSMPDPKFRPSSAHGPPPSYLVPGSNTDDDQKVPTTMSSIHEQLFVPVAELDDISVGYSFISAEPDPNMTCMPSNPFNPPCSTRYMFEKHTRTLLLVTHGGVPRTIGLRLTSTVNSICRKQICLLVPAAEYSWNNLPSHAFCMISNIEYKLDSIKPSPPQLENSPSSTVTESADDHLDISSGLKYLLKSSSTPLAPSETRIQSKNVALKATIGLIDAIIDTSGSSRDMPSSHQRTILPEAGRLSDGLAPTTTALDSSLTSAAFDCSVRSTGLISLRKTLSGLFTAPALRMDARLPNSNRLASCFTGRLSNGIALLAPGMSMELRQRFAHLYYIDVMAVSAFPSPATRKSDLVAPKSVSPVRLIAKPASRTAKRQHRQACTVVPSSEQRESAPQLAPRPLGTTIPTATQENGLSDEGNSGRGPKGKNREAILEARRIRNRLSAQRSNLERKQRYERLECDLEAARSQAQQLKQRHERVVRENEHLKSVLFTGCSLRH